MQEQFLLDGTQAKQSKLTGKFCGACSQTFENSDQHKLHYRSDFHAFNLKRKLVDLPPVSEEAFNESL